MSTDTFPSSNGPVSSKEDVMDLLSGGGKKVATKPSKPSKEEKPTQSVSSKDDVMDLLSGTVKKKESDSASSGTSLPSNTPSQNGDLYGNAVKNYENKSLTQTDVDVLAPTEFGKQQGLSTLTPEGKQAFIQSHNGPKTSDLYNKTLGILDASFPKTDDPKINEQRNQIIKSVTSGDQKSIIAARDKITGNIQNKINDLLRLRTSPNPMAGAYPGTQSTVTNLTPQDENTLASLKNQMQQADEVLNNYAINSMANSKETNAQVQAEVSGKHYSIVPHLAAEDLGKQVEKLQGGLPNPNGNIQYERQRAGLNTIIEAKQMKLNDLTTEAIRTKNPDIIKEANKQQQELNVYKGWKENLIDNFPDVAVTQTARLIGDELAESNPRMMIISKNDVEQSAKRIEQKYPGFIDKYGKYINVVAESEGSGLGSVKSGLVPKGGFTGGLQSAIEELGYGSAHAVAGLIGDTKTKQYAEEKEDKPTLKGTKFSGETPTKVVYDNEGKAFIEKPNEDYGKVNWNSATRFIGKSIPGLAAWITAETATGGLATAAGLGEGAASTVGLIGASYATSYDENKKYANTLVEDPSSLGEAKKAALANFLTLTTAGVFKMVGYSPAKFVENAITKSVGEDAMQMFEENGWKELPKSKVQEFIKDNLLPKIKSFGKNTFSSLAEGSKVGAATVTDTKIKDFVSTVVNPEKAQTSTDKKNIKQFAEQTLFMGLLGMPKVIAGGFTSSSMKDAFYDIGTRAPQYIESINSKIESGEYTREQGNAAIATAKTMAEEVSKAQGETTKDGLPLTLQQKKEIALQGFRKRAAAKMEDSGLNISSEKINNEADKAIKEVKDNPAHISLDETHAFKTAQEVEKDGEATGKISSLEDIDPDKKYTWENNDNKEKKGTGAELISFLTQSKEYEKPDKTTVPEGEKTEDKGTQAKGEGDEAKSKVATDLMLQDINSGAVKTPYKDLLESKPEHAEGVFKELVQQIKDGNESKLLDDGYSKEFVDAAKEFINSPKIESNESSKKPGSEETRKDATQADEKIDEGDGKEKLQKGNVNKEGAENETPLGGAAPSSENFDEKIKSLQEEKESKIKEIDKPKLEFETLSARDIIKSDDRVTARRDYRRIRERQESLKAIIECIWQ